MKRKIIITGITGTVGRVLYDGLKSRWQVEGIARNPVDGIPVQQADINDSQRLEDIFRGASAIIHLAANPNAWGRWEDMYGPNILGTENVFNAVQKAGVSKVIYASSNHAVGLYENDEPYRSIVKGKYEGLNPDAVKRIDHTSPVRPDGYYGTSKVFGEALGRYYAEKYGMRVYSLRIGTVNRQNRPHDVRQFATLLLHADLVELVHHCLLDETVRYDVFYGVSANTWRFWDTEHIKDVLGWQPEGNAETFRDSFFETVK